MEMSLESVSSMIELAVLKNELRGSRETLQITAMSFCSNLPYFFEKENTHTEYLWIVFDDNWPAHF